MIKRLLHMALGYSVKVTFPNGDTEVARAYLSSDCSVRVRLRNGRHCYLQTDGVVRGCTPGDNTRWNAL